MIYKFIFKFHKFILGWYASYTTRISRKKKVVILIIMPMSDQIRATGFKLKSG